MPLFHGFDDGEGERDEDRIAKRVAARFAMAMTVIPFRIAAPKLDASDILIVLRGHGVAVDEARLQPGSWPGQADVVGIRDGVATLYGVVAVDLDVDEDAATLRAEIRIHSEE